MLFVICMFTFVTGEVPLRGSTRLPAGRRPQLLSGCTWTAGASWAVLALCATSCPPVAAPLSSPRRIPPTLQLPVPGSLSPYRGALLPPPELSLSIAGAVPLPSRGWVSPGPGHVED